jgi:conjugal transfer pilin signal peptidase TrbI
VRLVVTGTGNFAGAWRWLLCGANSLRADMRRRWYLYAVVATIWALAAVRVLAHYTPVVPLLFNVTGSLPYHVAYVQYGSHVLARGDYIVYEFKGAAAEHDYPGLRDQPFFKRIAGVAGDMVTVADRHVFINGTFVGVAKPFSFDRRPLAPIAEGVIPPGYLYVQGTSPDSFDSRYSGSGLVAFRQVAAKVRPVL